MVADPLDALISRARRQGRGLLALFVLLVGAAPSWPSAVDDVYIALGYARHWAETGELAWTTGERVEGFSSPLFVAVMALVARLGLDVDLWAQGVALVSAAALLWGLHRLLPQGRAGTLALLAFAVWSPLDHWAGIGMESTLFALLVAMGWSGALRGGSAWGWGVAALALGSLTRPEGMLHLAIAPAIGWWRSRPRPLGGQAIAAIAVAGLLLVHGVRFAWFGALTATPYLVKVAAIPITTHGALQAAGELLTAAGMAVAVVLACRVRPRDALWILAPLAIEVAVIVRASGDWMAWGRILLPGVAGTLAATATIGEPRPIRGRAVFAATVVAVMAASAADPEGYGAIDVRLRDLRALARFPAHFSHGLDTPLAEDVAWAVDHVPDGATITTTDVGMLGDIPGVRTVDLRGLTHRPAAEAIAAGRAEEWMRGLLADPARRPTFLRLASWESEVHPEYPTWMTDGYAVGAELRYGGGSIRWYAQDDRTPDARQRRHRWDTLLARHPSQPFLRWHAALSATADEDLDRALVLLAEGHSRWPSMAEFAAPPRSVSFVGGTRALAWGEAGFALRCGERLVSRRIQAFELVVLHGAPPQGSRLVVTDEAGSGVANTTGTIPGSDRPRQLVVSLECTDASEAGATVWLGQPDPTPTR